MESVIIFLQQLTFLKQLYFLWFTNRISCFSYRQLLQNNRDSVTKETNEFKSEYGKYMTTMSKAVVEGKAEHSRLTEYVSYTDLVN